MTTSSTETQEPLLPSNDQISEAPTEADLDLYESLNGASVIATQEAILPTKDSLRESSRILHAYLAVAILVNFCLLFLKGYAADLGYWENWIKQLSTSGYNNFNGNYPPFYVHWLYFLGKFYTLIGAPLEANNFLKFLTQIPVTLSHCLLTTVMFSLLQRFNAPRYFLHIVMMLTALNPTILVNGPIWGQVDLIPITFVICALLLNFHQRLSYLAIPMFTLALFTKFQMIAFAPVFGFLFFHNIKKNLLGIIISIVLGSIIFMPSIIAGHFIQAFKLAYIDTLGQYPMTTFNAANVWILLTSNTAPDSQVLFDVAPTSPFVKIFTAKYFGMLLFVLIALWIFLHGAFRSFKNRNIQSNLTADGLQLQIAQAFFSSMLCAMAFFTFLPAMHERYLFPAAVLALAYVATSQKKLIYPITISLLCSMNMFIILELNGSDIWQGLAWLMVAIMSLGLLETFFGETLFNRLKSMSFFIYRIPALSVWIFIAAFSVMFFSFYDNYRIHHVTLKENQIFLPTLQQISATQDYGNLQFNRSNDGNTLSINNLRYKQGLGTHANSDIKYQLPDNAAQFSFIVGLDDEVGVADVQFSVWGDDKLLWQSKIFNGYEKETETYTVDVHNIKILTLKVAALKSDTWDHANWVNTVITLANNKPSP